MIFKLCLFILTSFCRSCKLYTVDMVGLILRIFEEMPVGVILSIGLKRKMLPRHGVL